MKSFSRKYNRWFTLIALALVGSIFAGMVISSYYASWPRFHQEPLSTYLELASTCKRLLVQEGLFDTNSIPEDLQNISDYRPRDFFSHISKYNYLIDTNGIPTEVYIGELSSKVVRIDTRSVNFSDRISRYSPCQIFVWRNWIYVLFYNRFWVWIRFFPIDNRWKVVADSPEFSGSYLLWEGDDDDL